MSNLIQVSNLSKNHGKQRGIHAITLAIPVGIAFALGIVGLLQFRRVDIDRGN